METPSPVHRFNIKASYVIIAIFAAGISLRIAGLTAAGIWYDESLSFHLALLPLPQMMQVTAYTFNPPLWGMVLWVSLRLLGANEFGLRFPSLICSFVSLWLTYKLCDEFKLTSIQKILVLLFAAFLPHQLWMAQDGRIYALMSALFLGAIWFALRNRWLGLTACAGLLMYAHSAGAFYAIAAYALAAINNLRDRKQLLKMLVSGVVAVISFLPWLPIFLFALKHHFDIPRTTILYLLQVFYQLFFANDFNGSLLNYLGVPAIVLCFLLALVFNAKMLIEIIISKFAPRKSQAVSLKIFQSDHYLQILLMTLIPFAIMLIISLGWKSIIYYRPLSALLIPIIFWLVFTLSQASIARLMKWIILPLSFILLGVGIVTWSPATKSGDLRDVASLIDNQWQDGDVVYHITGTSLLPFSHYLGNKPVYLLDEPPHDWLLPIPLQDAFGLKRIPLENLSYRRAWVVFARDSLLSDRAILRAREYIQGGTLVGIVESWQFARIDVYLVPNPVFTKQP